MYLRQGWVQHEKNLCLDTKLLRKVLFYTFCLVSVCKGQPDRTLRFGQDQETWHGRGKCSTIHSRKSASGLNSPTDQLGHLYSSNTQNLILKPISDSFYSTVEFQAHSPIHLFKSRIKIKSLSNKLSSPFQRFFTSIKKVSSKNQ